MRATGYDAFQFCHNHFAKCSIGSLVQDDILTYPKLCFVDVTILSNLPLCFRWMFSGSAGMS